MPEIIEMPNNDLIACDMPHTELPIAKYQIPTAMGGLFVCQECFKGLSAAVIELSDKACVDKEILETFVGLAGPMIGTSFGEKCTFSQCKESLQIDLRKAPNG